jgi:hypothetical protein
MNLLHLESQPPWLSKNLSCGKTKNVRTVAVFAVVEAYFHLSFTKLAAWIICCCCGVLQMYRTVKTTDKPLTLSGGAND